MKNLNGHISISRVSSNTQGEFVQITVTDDASHCQLIEVEMDMTHFAEALMNLSHRPCLIEANDGPHIGMLSENKTELVPIPKDIYFPFTSLHGRSKDYEKKERASNARMDEVLAPFEIDGWRASRGESADYRNMHRHVRSENGIGYFNIGFRRYVDPVTNQPIEMPR